MYFTLLESVTWVARLQLFPDENETRSLMPPGLLPYRSPLPLLMHEYHKTSRRFRGGLLVPIRHSNSSTPLIGRRDGVQSLLDDFGTCWAGIRHR